jgi:hypothetical protein
MQIGDHPRTVLFAKNPVVDHHSVFSMAVMSKLTDMAEQAKPSGELMFDRTHQTP